MSWYRDAACRDVGPDLFFGPDRERAGERREREARAKAICAACPVAVICRAAGRNERWGVWGGVGVEDRAGKCCPSCTGSTGKKPLAEFGVNSRRYDGHQSVCTACRNDMKIAARSRALEAAA